MDYAMPTVIEHTVDYKTHFWMEGSHYTDSWHLILVEEGSFVCNMLGEKFIASEYQAVIFPLDVEFNRKIEREMKIHYFGLKFNKDDEWLKDNGQFLCGLINVDKALVKQACEFCGKFHGNEFLALKDGVIKSLWSHIIAHHLQENAGKERVITNNAIRKAVDFMKSNLKNKISIEDMAKNLGFTHIQFTRLFEKEMGMPPVVYLNNQRLGKAKRLLGETGMSIGDIAIESGFDNQFYFHNRFKKKYGMAPSVYRKHTGGNGQCL